MPGEMQRYQQPTHLMRHSAERGSELVVTSEWDSWVNVFAQTVQFAEFVANTEFVPLPMRGKPDVITACVLAGREMHLGPMASLKHITIVRGRPTQSAEMMRAQVLAAGHEIEYPEQSDQRVIARGRRKGQSTWTQVTFTADQAKARGISLTGASNNNPLGSYTPEDKLVARATSRLCRRIFADCISGLPTIEEAEDMPSEGEEGAALDTGERPAIPPASGRRTHQRRTLTRGRPSESATGSPERPADSAPVPPAPSATVDAPPAPPAPPAPRGPEHADERANEPKPDAQNAPESKSAPNESPEDRAARLLEQELGGEKIHEEASAEPERPSPTAKMSIEAQHRALGITFTRKMKIGQAKKGEDDVRHLVTSAMIGRPIESWKELTYDEAGKVLAACGLYSDEDDVKESVQRLTEKGKALWLGSDEEGEETDADNG